jgi:hypothetical protein
MNSIARFASVLAVLSLAAAAEAPEAAAQTFVPYRANITVDQYLEEAGGIAQFVPAGRLELGGKRMMCGNRPSVLDPEFDTWAGAYTDPGFIIVNPIYMDKEDRVVQWYIYSHECGHQFRGFDEDTADEFAIRRGVRQGWLNDRGMDKVCRFIAKVPGDSEHPVGPSRCHNMKRIYAEINAHHREYVDMKRRGGDAASIGSHR